MRIFTKASIILLIITCLFSLSHGQESNPLPATINNDIVNQTLDDYCEDFDDLNVGQGVYIQIGDPWNIWWSPGVSHDAIVSDAQSMSPDNSMLVEEDTDIELHFGNETIYTGIWEYSHNIYIPTGKTGYWNIQKDVFFGVEWGFQVMYDDDGNIHVDAGAPNAVVQPFPYDTWIHNELIIDIDNDWCQFFIDGSLIVEYQWTLGTFGTPGANTLGGANFYAISGNVGTPPGAYFDDVCFGEIQGPCYGFDNLNVGQGIAAQLGSPWITWSGFPDEDAMVTSAQSSSPDNSFVVDNSSTDLVFQFGDQAIDDGIWLYSHYMYVPSGFSGYFNVQSEPIPGVDWVLDLYFDDGGSGHFGTSSTETFEYDQDIWILVEINFDLNSDLAVVLFDGVVMTEFVWDGTIGGIDYYGLDSGGAPGAYYDNVCLTNGYTCLDPPTNLTAVYQEMNIVLEWDPPGSKSLELYLLGYNIYHSYQGGDYSFLDYTTDTIYTHIEPLSGLHCYLVSAVYDIGESIPCEEACELIDRVGEYSIPVVQIYPNPATNFIHISSKTEIRSIKVYDVTGLLLYNKPINNSKINISTSEFDTGLYMFQIETNEGLFSEKVIIE